MERPPLPSTRTLDTLTWLVGATRGGTGSCCGAPRSRTAVGVVRRSEGVRFRARRGGHVGREGERTANSLDEALKERLGVARAGSGLRVELHREEGLLGVDDALVRAVVRVHKERGPVSRERLLLNGEAVVLRDPPAGSPCRHAHAVSGTDRGSEAGDRDGGTNLRRDEALAGLLVHARQVLAAVAEQHLARLGAGCKGQELVAEADTVATASSAILRRSRHAAHKKARDPDVPKDGLVAGQRFRNVLNGRLAVARVARAVATPHMRP